MGDGFVADDIAQLVLCAALKKRRACVSQLCRGHACGRRAVIRGNAGQTGCAGAEESAASCARSRSGSAASGRRSTNAGEPRRALDWLSSEVALSRSRRDDCFAHPRSPKPRPLHHHPGWKRGAPRRASWLGRPASLAAPPSSVGPPHETKLRSAPSTTLDLNHA